MKSHTGKEMANPVLQYLHEVCKLNFSKCRNQSYDNAANMSEHYKGMQLKFLETNKQVCYICALCSSFTKSGWPKCC